MVLCTSACPAHQPKTNDCWFLWNATPGFWMRWSVFAGPTIVSHTVCMTTVFAERDIKSNRQLFVQTAVGSGLWPSGQSRRATKVCCWGSWGQPFLWWVQLTVASTRRAMSTRRELWRYVATHVRHCQAAQAYPAACALLAALDFAYCGQLMWCVHAFKVSDWTSGQPYCFKLWA